MDIVVVGLDEVDVNGTRWIAESAGLPENEEPCWPFGEQGSCERDLDEFRSSLPAGLLGWIAAELFAASDESESNGKICFAAPRARHRATQRMRCLRSICVCVCHWCW
jgi:hypothetical protein